ncbi:MAG: zf-HC2 domain-containing protein [Anaerolineae bacterium]|nr:zf-HC2 domain-containing protein [Anaerolineae bacterium]MCB0242811.1 zf-HC2 domain-containing protein [Anaerolineae bacterium]
MNELPDNMNEHEIFSERMSLALDGLLADADQEAFDQHLAACEPCRARWLKWQRISDVLWFEPFAGPAQGFTFRVDDLVQHEQRRKERMLGGLVLVGGTVSIWTVMVLSVAITVLVGLTVSPAVRWQVAEYLGFGSRVVGVVISSVTAARDSLLTMPGPGALVLALCVLAALMVLWLRLVFWGNRAQPGVAVGETGRNGR